MILSHTAISDLCRGLSIALLLSIPGLSAYFFSYEESKILLAQFFPHWAYFAMDGPLNHLIAGSMAEIISGLFWTPMEVLKCKLQVVDMPCSQDPCMQELEETIRSSDNIVASDRLNLEVKEISIPLLGTADTKQNSENTWTVIKRVYREEGWMGFFKGYLISLWVYIPHSIIYFMVYEIMKQQCLRQWHEVKDIPFWAFLVCSGVAASLGAAFSNPMDILKTRIQVNKLEVPLPSKEGFDLKGLVDSLTAGMWARIAWLAPCSMISMTVYEVLKNY